MNTTYSAERTVIKVAGKSVEVFMMPDGSYRYSQTSVAKTLGKGESDTRNFLASESAKALLGTDLTPATLVKVGRTRVKSLTDIEATAYWQWKAENGNKDAKALLAALASEALTRRADAAFGVKVSEETYEANTAKLRLDLINKWAALYDQGDRQEFYESATEDEQEAVFAKVSIQRYQELFPGCPKAKEAIKYHQGVLERLGAN